MTILLDTQIAVWSIFRTDRLSRAARAVIELADDPVLSMVSIWEIAMKFAIGARSPDAMPVSGARALQEFERAGYRLLSVTPAHAAAVDALPRLHGDPFDRLLIAQAKAEPARFLTADARLAHYGDMVIIV